MKQLLTTILGLTLLFPISGFSWDRKDPDVVTTFDAQSYMGRWFEIAHKPNFFQRNCERSTAEYSLNDDGSINVYNTCYKDEKLYSSIKGTAKAQNPNEATKLKVDFGFLIKGDYWIIALDENYQWAVVSGPGLKSLFILSRTAPMDPTLLEKILSDLKAKGFKTDKFVFDKYERQQ